MATGPIDVQARRARSRLLWAVSLLLFLPALVPYLEHWCDRSGLEPSGFIQTDQSYYAANAREHFDDGGFHLFYGLPFSPRYDTPRLYFQPQSLVIGTLIRLGLDPALASLLFGIVAGVACVRVALALFERLFGLRRPAQWLAAIAWTWGGGLLVLLGATRWARTRDLDDLFAFDPAGGAWFLNFGRNLVFPTEAFYHLLWLAAILMLVKRKPWAALGFAALLSAAHPFAGLELALVLAAWTLLEAFWIRAAGIRPAHAAAFGGLVAAHLGYYVLVLGTSPEHRSVQDQWIRHAQGWTYEARHFVPAYALVAALALWRLRRPALALETFTSPDARLFATWALTCFALANNEFALKPDLQPMHFTRGYVWMGLFLLGAPALVELFEWLLAARFGRLACGALVALALVDNATFLATFHERRATGGYEMRLPPHFRDLAAWMSEPAQRGALVLAQPSSPDVLFEPVPYLLMTYTPLRTWKSHAYNTPDVLKRRDELVAAFDRGEFLPDWEGRKLIVLLRPGSPVPPWVAQRGGRLAYEDETFVAWTITPSAP